MFAEGVSQFVTAVSGTCVCMHSLQCFWVSVNTIRVEVLTAAFVFRVEVLTAAFRLLLNI